MSTDRREEEAALADIRKGEFLTRDYGGWWIASYKLTFSHRGPHKADTIKRLVKRKAVVIVRDRCVLFPKLQSEGRAS